jgi:hypothetical protein
MFARLFARFRCDRGAITVDWLVLTAAVVSLTLSLFAALSPALIGRGGDVVEPASISTNF